MRSILKSAVARGLARGQIGQNSVGSKGSKQLGHILRAFLQHAQRRPDAAGDGELDQRLQLRGPATPICTGRVDAPAAAGRPRR
jgi:hypothetical protein